MGEGNNFGVVDYLVVLGTLVVSLGIGIYYGVKGRNGTNEELLVGGRQMSILPVACSILVTYLSAITLLGYPGEIYSHGIQIFMMHLTAAFFTPLATYLFVYVFYNMRITSVYEYLEYRFETVVIRRVASLAYIFQYTTVTGVVLYAPSIALETILGVPMWVSVIGIGVCGTVYTSIGGIKAVVWTDVFQFVMILVGMVSISLKGFSKAGGFFEALHITEQHSRLHLFDTTIDPFMRHNALNFILGYGFNVLFLYGTYQQQVQRYCTLPTFNAAVKSISISIFLNVVTMTLVTGTGIAIFATYAGCDPVLLGHIQKSDQIVPYFVVQELANIPGMMGLFVACMFSAVLSSLSSTVNSLAAVAWQDFLARMPFFEKLSDAGQANTSKLLALFFGVLTIFVAFAAQYMGPILQATYTAIGATTGPLGGVFLVGLFMPCVNKWGALVGMLTGLTTMMFIGISSFGLGAPFFIPLPTDVQECPLGTNLTIALLHNPKVIGTFDWPQKLFTLSYLMYPFVGACITVLVALIVSGLTGGFSTAHKVKKKYLHPLLHGYFGAPDKKDTEVEETEDPQSIFQMRYHADRVKGVHS